MVNPLALVAEEAATEVLGAILDQPTDKFDPGQMVEDPEQRDLLIAGVAGGPIFAEAMKRVFTAAQEGRADKTFIKQIVSNFDLEEGSEKLLGDFAKKEQQAMARLITNVEKGTKASAGAARGATSKFKKVAQQLGRKADTVTGAPAGLLTEKAGLPPIPTEAELLSDVVPDKVPKVKPQFDSPIGPESASDFLKRRTLEKGEKAKGLFTSSVKAAKDLGSKEGAARQVIKGGDVVGRAIKYGKGHPVRTGAAAAALAIGGLFAKNRLFGDSDEETDKKPQQITAPAVDEFEGIRQALKRQPETGKGRRKSKAIQELEALERRLEEEF